MPLANANELNVAIGTTADNSGLTSAGQAIENYAAKLEIARQRVNELSQTENVKTSTMMAATNAVTNYEQKFDQAIQKADEEAKATEESAASHQNLAGAIVASQAAYNVLYGALQKSIQFFGSAIDSANNYQRAIAGLNSTSRAMGDNIDQASQAAQKLSADGLMPVTQSATALRNLLASGFSLPQAIQLMDALKDKLAFNRQGYDNMGDAIVHATKGIELGNTKMLEATGVNEKLNAMLKQYGVSTNDLGNLQGSAAARQAIVNGVLQNAAGNYGDAAKASEIFGAKQAAAGTAVENLKIQVGGIEQLVGGPLLQSFTTFLNNNQRLIIDFGIATVVAGGLAAAILAIGLAIEKFGMDSIIATMSNPFILALELMAVLAGVAVYNAVDRLQSKVKEMNLGLGAGADNAKKFADRTGQLTQAQQSLADKLAQVNDQISKNNRDFMQSLADTINGIETKAASLKDQLSQENSSYADANAKRLDQFKMTQDSMTEAHQKRIYDLQKQLDKETALGKWADQAKLADIEQKIADENDQYNQQLTDKQTTYNQDVADAKQSHDAKTNDLQKQLDTENALLKKHAADVSAVRNVQMLDEIDKIKQTHDDQIAALDDQKQKAIKSAQQTLDGINNAYTKGAAGAKDNMSTIGSSLGKSMGDAFLNALEQSFTKDLPNLLKQTATFLKNSIDLNPVDWFNGKAGTNGSIGGKSLSQIWKDAKPHALGGPVMAGQPYLVGDNPDGSINSTTEMFVPEQSGTIIPASQTRSLLGGTAGGKGVTINQTNHIYNQVDMNAANLEMGWRLVNA